MLGVTLKTYQKYINDGKIPSSVLVKLANVFSCSIDYLLGLTA